MQSTNFYKYTSRFFNRLGYWAVNPWRRYSLFLILFLLGFILGSSLGMINGALAIMDPIGAFVTTLFLELMVRLRFSYSKDSKSLIIIGIIDMFRVGIIYGLFTEALKLL